MSDGLRYWLKYAKAMLATAQHNLKCCDVTQQEQVLYDFEAHFWRRVALNAELEAAIKQDGPDPDARKKARTALAYKREIDLWKKNEFPELHAKREGLRRVHPDCLPEIVGEYLPKDLLVRTEQTIGQRIDKLRLDCGWSESQLAEETGRLDKKSVQRHISGKSKPNPATVKLYADTFSRALGRKVFVAELRG